MRFIYSLNNILEFYPTDDVAMPDVNQIKKSKKIIEFEGGNIEGFYSVNGDTIVVTVRLTTPLGNIMLGSVAINPMNPTAVISGGNEGYKAKIYLDLQDFRLKLNGMICIPFYGCKVGNAEVSLDSSVC